MAKGIVLTAACIAKERPTRIEVHRYICQSEIWIQSLRVELDECYESHYKLDDSEEDSDDNHRTFENDHVCLKKKEVGGDNCGQDCKHCEKEHHGWILILIPLWTDEEAKELEALQKYEETEFSQSPVQRICV